MVSIEEEHDQAAGGYSAYGALSRRLPPEAAWGGGGRAEPNYSAARRAAAPVSRIPDAP